MASEILVSILSLIAVTYKLDHFGNSLTLCRRLLKRTFRQELPYIIEKVLGRQKDLVPIHYIGWTFIALAVLRLFNKADLNLRWKFAFSTFTTLYSLGKLAAVYLSKEFANLFYLLSAAAIIIPFLKINYKMIRDVEKVSEASLLMSIGIIVLLS